MFRMHDMCNVGLQRLRDNTFLSLDQEKTEGRMRGIIEKFEANNLMAQGWCFKK